MNADDAFSDSFFETTAYGPAPEDFRIGLAPVATARWFEPWNCDPAPRKDRLLAQSPLDVWGELKGSRAAQQEVLDLVNQWLGRAASPVAGPPLYAAARLIEDDLCLMQKHHDQWRLTAASLSSASFFTPEIALGKALSDLHGPVPGFNTRFVYRIARIFDHLAADSILERRNWSIVNSGELSLPRAGPVRDRIKDVTLEAAPGALFLRSERQTIRRLPQSGAIIFTIRIWREALGVVLTHPVRRAAFEAAWRAAMDESSGLVRRYKSLTVLAPLIEPLLITHNAH